MASIGRAIQDSEARHILSFSGGKDSTALGVHMLETYPKLNLEFVFCDTGAELVETYQYIDRFEAIFGVNVKRLNVLKMLGIRVKADRTPFDVYLKEYYGGFLPSPQARWCTRVLKIKPFENEIGTDRAYSYIGIRADENRGGYQQKSKPTVISNRKNIIPVYPFQENGFGLEDVRSILVNSGLGMPPYYNWRSRSGCYFCFYQQIGEWQGLKENHPELFESAKSYEKEENGRKYTWMQDRSLSDIEKLDRKFKRSDSEQSDGCAVCHL